MTVGWHDKKLKKKITKRERKKKMSVSNRSGLMNTVYNTVQKVRHTHTHTCSIKKQLPI